MTTQGSPPIRAEIGMDGRRSRMGRWSSSSQEADLLRDPTALSRPSPLEVE